MKYYIGDLRYSGSINYPDDIRQFDSVREMNLEMSRRWNSVVTPYDTVYILGNLCHAPYQEWMDRIGALQGRKILIIGEYDMRHLRGDAYSLFDSVTTLCDTYDRYTGMSLILCHYPIFQYYKNKDPRRFMLYSQAKETEDKQLAYNMIKRIRKQHREGKLENCGQIINVAATQPYMDYTPRPFSYLLEELDSGRLYNEPPTIREVLDEEGNQNKQVGN